MTLRKNSHANVPAVVTIIAFSPSTKIAMHWKRQIDKMLNCYENNLYRAGMHDCPWWPFARENGSDKEKMWAH